MSLPVELVVDVAAAVALGALPVADDGSPWRLARAEDAAPAGLWWRLVRRNWRAGRRRRALVGLAVVPLYVAAGLLLVPALLARAAALGLRRVAVSPRTPEPLAVAAIPLSAVLVLLAGGLRSAVLAVERTARRADRYADDPMFPIH